MELYIYFLIVKGLYFLLQILSKFDATIAVLIGSFFAIREFKYKAIHNKRIDILTEAYEKIKRAHMSLSRLTNPISYTGGPTEQEKNEKFVLDGNEMIKFLEEKRLFFSTKELIYIDKIKKSFQDNYSDYITKEIYKNDDKLRKESYEIWFKLWNSVDKDMKILLDTFELELKKVLNIK